MTTPVADPKTISMHIHSFSLRFRLKHHPGFDVFSYIDLAADEGFTGVNISANGPGYRDLGGTTDAHFDAVRDHLRARSMRCEIDTSDTRFENMSTMLGVASAVGADRLRTYTKYQGALDDLIAWTIRDLRAIAPMAADLGIVVVLENHEDFQGAVIARILESVDHPNIRALYDYGNSQMVGEDPLDALRAMQPFVTTVHMKDHVIVADDDGTIVQGVPIGDGFLPIAEQTEMLYAGGLRRFCFENVWAYSAPVTVAVSDLPTSPSFSQQHHHHRLDGRTLDPSAAVEGEWAAFRSAWDWLRADLAQHRFVIAPE
jgi:sugar phosphate isomerase/epimerase